MVRKGKSKALRTIKERANAWSLRFSHHAVLEMIDEDITKDDVQKALVGGTLRARQTGDFLGPRYVLRGAGVDGGSVEVVCCIIPQNIRVITVYRIE